MMTESEIAHWRAVAVANPALTDSIDRLLAIEHRLDGEHWRRIHAVFDLPVADWRAALDYILERAS